ncbi:hypothetical protein ABFS82_07G009000 [Erythranthe guttata]
MRGVGGYPSSASSYWSTNQRFEPTRTTATATATASASAIKANNPNLVYRIRNSSPSTAVVTSPIHSSSSWAYSKYDKKSEVKRKRRIISYKAYVVEGKVKASIRSTFRFIKNKYSSIVHGYN